MSSIPRRTRSPAPATAIFCGLAPPSILDLLHGRHVAWTSIDLIRIFTDEGNDNMIAGPLVVWAGVSPDSLQAEDAFNSANGILQLLARFSIDDVKVEYREESVYKSSASPALVPSVSELDDTVDVRGPLTPA
ncbi:hypothetical protein L227DRAFT_653959 [Lentinus tigrinus ALCF2SS1-6]|uniref:Uncharacterized protein n=1 Tax=Lentinus tigrinus ALCF2SS1-6 TaxID=1328759 RepID=A0A5C2S7L0_9APHY|nr:hypothetical protein L227DRAFT_653959 [Lentinus tigrinus ALCF2SS1-6]